MLKEVLSKTKLAVNIVTLEIQNITNNVNYSLSCNLQLYKKVKYAQE